MASAGDGLMVCAVTLNRMSKEPKLFKGITIGGGDSASIHYTKSFDMKIAENNIGATHTAGGYFPDIRAR